MPFRFTGKPGSSAFVAKNAVVSDGDTFTTDGYGTTVSSTLSANTAFSSVPVNSGTGVWSVALKDSAALVLDVHIVSVLTTGNYRAVQLRPNTTVASGQFQGALVLNWVFNVAGTPTDLPAGGKFRVYVVYAEAQQG